MGLKIPPYKLDTMANTDPSFYELMGPFLSKREVVAELGSPVWDDDSKVWTVAHIGPDVLGFVAIRPPSSVQSFYVVPDARSEAIGAALLDKVVRGATGTLKAVATPASVRLFEMYGFRPTGARGSFTTMERTVNQ